MNIPMSRRHRFLDTRADQIKLNQLAAAGGRPYIDRRLWRQPNETDLSWSGSSAAEALGIGPVSGAVGRKARACCTNDVGRVVNKITQYLFKTHAVRDGMNDEWAANVTGDGDNINAFWMAVNDRLTTSQWLWIQVDRPCGPTLDELGNPVIPSLQQKKDANDAVIWRIWDALSVPDWYIAPDGKLGWILVESETYDNSDPFAPAKTNRIRTLFRREEGRVLVSEFSEKPVDLLRLNQPLHGYDEIPFIPIGKPSADGWWLDDLEMIQAQIMNLDSLHNENLSKTVYPQLVIPASMAERLKVELMEIFKTNGSGEKTISLVKALVRGLEFPFVEGEGEGNICRYLTPDANSFTPIPLEMARKRDILFYIAGLALFNKESRETQTAESKEFDHLDTSATLKNRALIMQDAEKKLLAISQTFDPAFPVYEPKWPSEFDVTDIGANIQAITQTANLPGLTPAMRKIALHAALKILQQVSPAEDALIQQARYEIDADEPTGAPWDEPAA